MTRSKFLIGISGVALTTVLGAGAASAQQNTNNISCPTADPANTCTVTQGPSSNENTSDVAVISGSGNNITIDQRSTVLSQSTARVAGNNNFVQHTQFGI
jgi:hypothetical protein